MAAQDQVCKVRRCGAVVAIGLIWGWVGEVEGWRDAATAQGREERGSKPAQGADGGKERAHTLGVARR